MPDQSPLTVSVVIPAFNAAEFISDQLDSLNAQEVAREFEIVVADNGSADRTHDVVRDYDSRLPIRWVDASQRQGAAWARNKGVEAAHGELILFCDADDVADPHWVSELTWAAEQTPGSIISGNLLHDLLNTDAIARAYGTKTDIEVRAQALSMPRTAPHTTPFAGFLPSAPGGSFAMHRTDYLRIGGMAMTFGSEETDFVWRAQLSGVPIMSAPRAFINYRLKDTSSRIFHQQRIQQRERILLWTRYRQHGMIGPSLKFSLLQLILNTMRFVMHGRDETERYSSVWHIGANLGAIQGIFKYRILPNSKIWRG